jgi:hypothetical protein
MYYGVHTSDQDYVPYANFQYPNGVVLLGNTAANFLSIFLLTFDNDQVCY